MPFCCTRVNEIMTGCKILVNAHAHIKDGTVFSHDRVFVCTGKNDSKTQRVDVDFFEKEKKISVFQQTCGFGLNVILLLPSRVQNGYCQNLDWNRLNGIHNPDQNS